MSNIKKFFSEDGNKRAIFETIRVLGVVEKPSDFFKAKVEMLKFVLNYVLRNSEDFDDNCQLNIGWIGDALSDRFNNVSYDNRQVDVDFILIAFHRLITEYDLSIGGDLDIDLEHYQNFIKINIDEFSEASYRSVRHTEQQLCVKMVKSLLHDSLVGDLRNVPPAAKKINEQVKEWDKAFNIKKTAVEKLEESLDRYKTEFNFLALDVGFGNLAKNKVKALFWSRVGMGVFGFLLPMPLMFELFFIYGHQTDMAKLDPTFLISSAIISFSITLLLIYFFRIILGNSESCKAQILQLELRRELCRFVQEYVEYAEGLKTKSPETLAKFETLIFSGITMNNDQSLSIFDGIDKIGDIVKSYKSQ